MSKFRPDSGALKDSCALRGRKRHIATEAHLRPAMPRHHIASETHHMPRESWRSEVRVVRQIHTTAPPLPRPPSPTAPQCQNSDLTQGRSNTPVPCEAANGTLRPKHTYAPRHRETILRLKHIKCPAMSHRHIPPQCGPGIVSSVVDSACVSANWAPVEAPPPAPVRTLGCRIVRQHQLYRNALCSITST